MTAHLRVVVVDDRRTERFDILRRLIEDAIPHRPKELLWLSEFTLSSWSRSEIASGVAFDDVLKIKPHLLIFDLVLFEQDVSADMVHAWQRGLRLLKALYAYARPVRRKELECLPTRAILISATFGAGGNDHPEFQIFELAKQEVAKELDIVIDFFHWGELASPSPYGSGNRQSFADTIKKIAG